MVWKDYYDRFYDWAESTQVRYLSKLTTLGPADEVAEIIIELQVNIPAADRLLRKAVEAKLAFSASDLIEFLCINNRELAVAAVYNSAKRFTAEDMEFLYGEVDDEVIIQICSQQKLPLPEDLREEEYVDACDDEEFEDEAEIVLDDQNDFSEEDEVGAVPAPKLGFWGGLALLLGLSGHSHGSSNHCNGDCANCPPHYGYRYGRWYYGHGHQHGCERGGNGGASGKCYRD